jgi:arabinofuranosyltransferase
MHVPMPLDACRGPAPGQDAARCGRYTRMAAPSQPLSSRAPAEGVADRARAAQEAAVRAYRRGSLAIAGLAVAFYAVFIARSAFTVNGRTYFSLFDDAMISMRYARNLAHGAGLAWNAGQQPVEGYTNFLWTVWMSALHLTGVSDAKASLLVMISGAVILVANLLVVRAVAETVAPGRRGAALVAMAATAAYYPLAYWTLRGMEVGLIALMCSAMALYALRLEREFDTRTLAKLAAVFAAGVLTRDDVVVPCAVVTAFVVIRCAGHRRAAVAVLGGSLAAAIGAHEAYRLAYYGSALPNTYELKLGGIPIGSRLSRGVSVLAAVTVHALMAPIALAVAGLGVRARRVAAGLWLLAAMVVAEAAYSAYVGGDAWEFFRMTNRFLTPVVPLLFVLAAVGFARLREAGARLAVRVTAAVVAGTAILHLALGYGTAHPEIGAGIGALLVAGAISVALARGRSARLVWPLLAVALVVATAGDQLHHWRWDGAAYAEADAGDSRRGVRVREATSPHTSIAVVRAGATPYFDHRPSIDLLGKSDTVIAHERPHPGPVYPGHMKWDYAYSLRQRPELITELWKPTAADLVLLKRAGYVRVSEGAGYLYVRRDARGVNRARLARAGA